MADNDLKLDDFDFDSDLDFDLGVDDVDNKINKDVDSKKRSPVSQVISGSIAGAKSKVTDPGTIKNFVMGSLPKEYGVINEHIDSTVSSLTNLYDDSIKTVKPKLHLLAKKLDRAIPENQKLAKKIAGKVKDATETHSFSKLSSKEIEDRGLQQVLGDTFGTNETKRSADLKEKFIEDNKDFKKFSTNLGVLRSIDEGVNKLSDYTTTITQAYQKKSLELQYRSYFVQSELLKTNSKYFEAFSKQNEAITKNTGLPEYSKIELGERFKDTAKRNLAEGLQNSLFGKGTAIGNIVDKIKSSVTDIFSGISEGLENAIFISDSADDKKEIDESMGVAPKSAAHTLGSALSGNIIGKVLGSTSDKIRSKLEDDTAVSEAGHSILRNIKDPTLLRDKIRNSDFFNSDNETKNSIGDALSDLLVGKSADLTDRGQNLKLESPGVYTNRTDKAITDIIPGYLSKILKEVSIMRTGQDVDTVEYDYDKGTFSTSSVVSNNISNNIQKGLGSKNFNSKLDVLLKEITAGKELTPEQTSEARNILTDIVIKSPSSSPELLSKSLANASGETAALLKENLDKNILGATERVKAKTTDRVLGLKESLPQIKGVINKYIANGQQDYLTELGIIDLQPSGGYTVNVEKYKELLLNKTISETPRPPTSGPTVPHSVKAHVVPISPTPGPTTQHSVKNESVSSVHATFNDTNIVNGLTDIRTDTTTIIDILKSKGGGTGGGNGNGGPTGGNGGPRKNFSDITISDIVNTGAKAVGDVFSIIGGVGSKAAGLGKGLLDMIDFDSFKNIISADGKLADNIKGLFSKGIELSGAFIGKTKDLLLDTVNLGTGLGKKLIEYGKKGVAALLEYSGDIYAKGMSSPAIRANLLKMGYYKDQITGDVIKSIKDIKGAVVDAEGNVVISLEDIANGLLDKHGVEIKLPTEKILAFAKGVLSKGFGRLKGAYNYVAGIGANIRDRIFNKDTGSDGIFSGKNASKSYDILVEIRDILNDRLSPAKVEPAAPAFKFNDRDKSGDRDNSAADRLKTEEEREAKRKKGPQKANTKERYKSGNVFDTIMNGLKGIIGKAGDVFGSIGDLAAGKGIKDTLEGVLDRGKKGGGKIKGAGKNALGKASKLGSKISGLAGKAGKFLKLGSLATAAGGAGSVLSGIGATAVSAGSSILAGLGSAATAAASVISAPVLIGTAAVALTGYGIYKGVKYFTRNNINKYEAIRLSQYGLTITEYDEKYNSELLNLEGYLLDDKIGYRKGTAYLLKERMKVSEILDIFNIDYEDNERVESFVTWFRDRFKPFFLTHLTALYGVNNKVKLNDLDDLTPDELTKYIEASGFENGPYGVETSPFIDIAELPNTKLLTKAKIEDVMSVQRKALSSKFDSKKVASTISAAEKSKKNTATTKVEVPKEDPDAVSRVREAKKNIIRKNKTNTTDLATDTYAGEESKSPNKTAYKADTSAVTNTSKVPLAGGDYKSGENGMSYIKAGPHVDFSGVNENLLHNFKGMAEEYGELTGKSLHVNSAYRSPETQARLYRQNPGKAARPGRSLHEFGLALDVNTVDLNAADKLGLMRKYGFTRPVGGETWHTEPSGIQPYIQEAKVNPQLANKQIEYSLGRGGAGIATIAGARKNRRDAKYALSLLEQDPMKPTVKDTTVKKPVDGGIVDVTKSGKPELATSKPTNVIPIDKPVGSHGDIGKISSNSKVTELPDVETKPSPSGKPELVTSKPIDSQGSPSNIVPKDTTKLGSVLPSSTKDASLGSPAAMAKLASNSKVTDLPDVETKPTSSGKLITAASKPIDSQGSPSKKANLRVVPRTTSSKVQEEGQSFNLTTVETELSQVHTTLTDSLSVQREMLESLKEIIANTDSSNLKDLESKVKTVANRPTNTTNVPKPAISMRRKQG